MTIDKMFDPQYSYFEETEVERRLFPSKNSQVHDPNFMRFYEFSGIMVGKAI